MAANNVNREQRLSQVLSVRLRERELRRLQDTLRNFEIQGDSLSEQLRALFQRSYMSSVRWRRAVSRSKGY